MSNAPASTTMVKELPKVLRIGVVKDGKIAKEQLMKHGESVIIGDAGAAFPVEDERLKSNLEIFAFRGGVYYLSVPDWVEGKVAVKEGIQGLDELRASGQMAQKGELFQLPLHEGVKGKLAVGSTSILFQFVPAPPEPVKQVVSVTDAKVGWMDEDDPLFLGLLGVFGTVAFLFGIYARIVELPPREPDAAAVQDVIDAIQRVEKIQLEAPPEPTPEEQGDKPAEEKKAEKPKPDAAKSESTAKAPAAKSSGAPSQEQVASKSLLLQMIGSAGDASTSGTVAEVLNGSSSGDLASALQGVSGVESASAGSSGLKGGSGGGKGDAEVGMGLASGGTSAGPEVKKVTVKPVVKAGSSDIDVEEGDKGSILSVVSKNKGAIQSCLDAALKRNPKTSGRVAVSWSIQGGKVQGVTLKDNTTNDDALGACIVGKVRTFRFDPSVTADVAEFPWVLSGVE